MGEHVIVGSIACLVASFSILLFSWITEDRMSEKIGGLIFVTGVLLMVLGSVLLIGYGIHSMANLLGEMLGDL